MLLRRYSVWHVNSGEPGQIRLLKLPSQGLQRGQAELFLKLTAAVTHSSYGPLTSYSSHQTSDPSHSDSNEPTCSQICSINITFTPNLSSCAGYSEKTRFLRLYMSPLKNVIPGLKWLQNNGGGGRVNIASKDGGSWGQNLSLVENMEKSVLTMYALFGGLVENLIRQPQALLSLHGSSN
ncbi:hypothetical protein LEMLEM_LOCUS15438 [Lemmus lemmus]